MDSRTANILEAVVREFIETGEPVSSGWLYDNYDFGIRPAMIRFEMNGLTERGYLEQPHHAAGRVPTNRGYEFFADHVLGEEPAGRVDKELSSLFDHEAWPELLSRMSETLGLLGVAVNMATGEVYKSGLENLIDNLEWQNRAELKAIIRDFDELDERIVDSLNERATRIGIANGDLIKVFVGRKSPITRSECLSVIAGDFERGGRRVVLCAIGPTRMNYLKTAQVFKGFKARKSEARNTKSETN